MEFQVSSELKQDHLNSYYIVHLHFNKSVCFNIGEGCGKLKISLHYSNSK